MAQITLSILAKNTASQSLSAINKQIKTLSTELSSIKVNKDLTTQINALTKYYNSIATAVAKVNTATNKQALAEEKLATQQQKTALQAAKVNTELSKQTLNATKTQKALNITANSAEKLQKDYADLLTTLKSIEKNYPKGTFDSIKTSAEDSFKQIKLLHAEIGNNLPTQVQQDNIQRLADSLNTYQTQISTTQAETKSLHGTLTDIVGGFLKFQLSAMLVMKPLQLIRSALASINETLIKTEDAVIALQRVLPSGSASDSEISGRLYKIAQEYGQTFENVQQIAQNFARTGMSWADTIKATEAAVLALNVAELDATQASDGMIAILTQFGLKATDLTLVVDKLNITADNAAVTTEKLLAALQRTGSAAANANLSLDETISLITALSEATGRSGENLGTALNSLIQYSSKASALDTFAGLSDESAQVVADYRKGAINILEVWKQVAKEIENLDTRQADLLDNYFNTEDGSALKEALDGELQDIYTELGGVYDTANTFRKNYFIALLGNMDSVLKAEETLKNAQGYSQDENQKYLDTYTAKLNKLKAQWEEIANSEQGLLGIKKFFVDTASTILTLIQHLGGLRTILIAVATIIWQLAGAKIISGLKNIGIAIAQIFTQLKTGMVTLNSLAGLLGIIATLASAIVGYVNELQARKERKILEDLDNAQYSLKDLSKSLNELEDQYKDYIKTISDARSVLDDKTSSTEKLQQAQNTLLKLQSDLIRNNKSYQGSLDLVNGSLDEQLNKLKELQEENARKQVSDWINSNKDATYEAKKYLSETGFRYIFDESSDIYGNGDTLLYEFFKNSNRLINSDDKFSIGRDADTGSGWDYIKNVFGGIFGAKTYSTFLDAKNFTRGDYVKLFEELLEEVANSNYTDEQKDYISAQLTSALNYYKKGQYNDFNSLINGDLNSTNWIERLSQEQREQFARGDLTYAQIKKILGIEEEITEESDKWTNNIKDVTGKYADLISKLEELRDLQKESTEWEEKKLAVMEAEKALENARNEATIRRFNSDTNQWEWQADEKAIADAEKNLQEAQMDLQEKAYDNIIEQLEKEETTNESILAILKEVAPLLGVDNDFVDSVTNAIKDITGVDINQPIIDKEKSFDNGGIANGLGFLPKATERAETVNNPEITSKILSPVSNMQFDKFTRDLGIIFETSRQYAQSPIINRSIGNTDNSINNSGQVIIKDINLGADNRDSFIDVLGLYNIVPN